MGKRIFNGLLLVLTAIFLYLCSRYNYLLFHMLVEVFSVCIAFTIFVLAWNSDEVSENNYLMIVGVGYLFLGLLDLLHTAAFKGMGIFLDYDYYANQLWIVARYMESLTLLISLLLVYMRRRINKYFVILVYTGITTIALLTIFYWKVFPICFIDGVGLTPFKKMSEYIICGLLGIALLCLIRNKKHFTPKIFHYIFMSILVTIFSELSFTFYKDNYGLFNLIGHYFKVISYLYIYFAIVNTGIREPYNLIFRSLQTYQQKLKEQNDALKLQVNVDGLTQLFNHSHIYELLEAEIIKFSKNGNNLTACMMDIDFFKEVNDEFGHLVGDEVIRKTAQIIQSFLSPEDPAGRYGGEEFLVVFRNKDLSEAYERLEQMRKAIEAYVFEKDLKVTISGGMCQYKSGKAKDVVKACDENLYKAKHQGRNKIIK